MCGICGIASGNGVVDEHALRTMNANLIHRGPDEDGFYLADHVGLAMRRLSIIDLAGGHQPVHDETKRTHLVFNGEIYNHRELRVQLQARGHEFLSRSDTEVLVHAYEDDGPAAFSRLRGMFAVAVWDARRSQLVLAVDRIGIKPLYYSHAADQIVFASELSALRSSGLCRSELDFGALGEYFQLGYIGAPATAFSGAHKLAPATYLSWSPGHEPSVERYWEAPPVSRTRHRRQYAPSSLNVRACLRDAVACHLESDVPVGAFLSGGVDSSSVVALMREAGAERLSTFSVGFAPEASSELPMARVVADRFGTDHHEYVVTPDATSVLPELARHFGEPFGDSSALMTYYVAKMASEHVKVALSGDGGDEVFLGYPMYLGIEVARRLEHLPASIRRALSHTIPQGESHLRRRMIDSLGGVQAAYRSKMSHPGLSAVAPYFTAAFAAALSEHHPMTSCERTLDEELARTNDVVEAVARASLRYSLPGDMLTKVDRTSMASSIEVRVPLLDHLLVEALSEMSVRERMPRWRLKALLKEAMADVLPQEVLHGPKRGFQAPVAAWIEQLRNLARELLVSQASHSRGYIDVPAVEAWLSGSSGPPTNEADVLWSLVMFELWCTDAGA